LIVNSTFHGRDTAIRPVSAKHTAGGTRIAPTSLSQQALWVLGQVLPEASVYNESDVFRLRGALDIEALKEAVNEIVRRHQVLRTRFAVENGEPVQVIVPELKVPLEVTDLSAFPPCERETEAQRLARDEAQARFDLEHGPLIRMRLLRMRNDEHWLVQTMHHIIRDGGSMVVFAHELSALYGAHSLGQPSPLPELPVQYADYALWQREQLQREVLKEQLAYWKQKLADLPLLELPTDRPRPVAPSYRGGRIAFELGEELTRGLKELRRQEETTLFTTLLAAFQVLLYRYSGQEDIAVGVAIAGRTRPELKGLIGYFVNMLVLRADLSGEPSFREYLARVRRQTRDAYAHQDVPFAKLVEELTPKRDPSRNPLFQVSFVKGTEPGERAELRGLTVDTVETKGTETVKFDLNLSAVEEDQKIRVVIDYATDLFDASTIERMAGHWRVLLEGIVADPAQAISRLPLLTAAEREQLLTQCNATAADYPRDTCIHQLFEAQVRRTPEATAVVFEAQQLIYSELNARANQLAHYLRTLGVGPEVLVAIAMERSLELVVGLLGILKAGGAYVPLDPSYPAERLAFMLADTRAPVLLTQKQLLGRLPTHAAHTLCLDRDRATIATQPNSNPAPSSTADNLAYVIYTSGSTGTPNGVMIEHRSLVNHMLWMQRRFPLETCDRVLQKTPASADAAVWEFYAPLLNGACLVIADPGAHRSPTEIVNAVVQGGITVLQLVPSMLAAILDEPGIRSCLSLHRVYCGGEALSTQLVRRFHAQSRAELINLYGPTEATIDSTFWVCTADDEGYAERIGRPIDNVSAYVLGPAREPVPVGVVGELHLGGDGVARGYWRCADLSHDRFIANPFDPPPAGRLYRTGDLARFYADGTLGFVGRRDQQVKIRGRRIELGEVESCLAQHPKLSDAIVVVHGRVPGDARLVAYVVRSANAPVTAAELREFVASRLPDFMVPAAYVTIDAFPRLPNGKVDRKRLPVPPRDGSAADSALYAAPGDGVEEQLAAIFGEVLGLDRVGVHSNFFELGGDSLLAVQTLSRVKAAFAASISIRSFFSAPNVAQLARQIEAQRRSTGASSRVSGPAPEIRRNPRIPLSRASGTGSE
jgi:amino acid adenylation domain-containing protein